MNIDPVYVIRGVLIVAYTMFSGLMLAGTIDPVYHQPLMVLLCVFIVGDACVYWIHRRRAFYLLFALWCLIDCIIFVFACSYSVRGLIIPENLARTALFSPHATLGPDNVLRGDMGTALYFSVVTITTLGYGDIQPSYASRTLAMVEALVGICAMGLFVAFLLETRKDLAVLANWWQRRRQLQASDPHWRVRRAMRGIRCGWIAGLAMSGVTGGLVAMNAWGITHYRTNMVGPWSMIEVVLVAALS